MQTEDKQKILIVAVLGALVLFMVVYAISIFGEDDGTTQRQVANLSVPNVDLEQQKKQYQSKLEAYAEKQKKQSLVEISFENPFAVAAETIEGPGPMVTKKNYDSLLQVIEQLKSQKNTTAHQVRPEPDIVQKTGPGPAGENEEAGRRVRTNPVYSKNNHKEDPEEGGEITTQPLEAMVPENQEIRNGQRLTFKITKEGLVNGQKVPVNTTVFGITSFRNERVLVSITTIKIKGGKDIYKTLSVYDQADGLEGIYVPGSINQEIGKDVAREGVDDVGGSLNLPIGSVKLGTKKKIEDPTVRILKGYRIIIKPGG